MKSTSSSCQMTSVQNCLTVPPMIGPRQTTGSVSFSRSRLMDMTSMPVLVRTG